MRMRGAGIVDNFLLNFVFDPVNLLSWIQSKAVKIFIENEMEKPILWSNLKLIKFEFSSETLKALLGDQNVQF